MIVLGWDIGGSNTKVCRVVDGRLAAAVSRPFEVKEDPAALGGILRELAPRRGTEVVVHAVTMTAELSRVFLTKREGVGLVLDAVESAFDARVVRVFTVDGIFVSTADARRHPLRVAAANWMATAAWLARTQRDAVMVDMGSTTTDIIPIVAGRVVAEGLTDPDRLASGELLYTGALRTPVEALASEVCVQGRSFALAAEAFATTADIHGWRGDLAPADRPGAGHRLARALCADRELMDDASVTALADALAAAQVNRVAASIARVAGRHPSIRRAVVAGAGAFIAARAAQAAGLDVCDLADTDGPAASQCAPAAAVARLLEAAGAIDAVVKVGGSLLKQPDALHTVLDLLDRSSHTLVVPGGGPYADDVRKAYRRGDLDDDGAHWAAVHAMEQFAAVLVARMPQATRIGTLSEARQALAAGYVPVLTPWQWLRDVDPLPHSWDVTSDSIAAWVAGQIGVRRLVLVKAPGATGDLVDAYFEKALPAGLDVHVVPADQVERLREALQIDGRTNPDLPTT